MKNTSMTIVVLLFVFLAPPLAFGAPRTHIPAIAHIGGIVVGKTTIKEMEHRFGSGTAVVGGHPNGAREWISRQMGWWVYADGFDYNDSGRLAYSFEVAARPDDKEIPIHSIPRYQMLFLNRIGIGAPRARVESSLWARHIPITAVTEDELTCEQHGYAPDGRHGSGYATWTATLTMENGRVTDIRIDCE